MKPKEGKKMSNEIVKLIEETAQQESVKALAEEYIKDGYTEDEALDILRQLQYV